MSERLRLTNAQLIQTLTRALASCDQLICLERNAWSPTEEVRQARARIVTVLEERREHLERILAWRRSLSSGGD
jgi:hypothetical protein